MRRSPTNPEVIDAMRQLYAQESDMLKALAEQLNKGSAIRVCVNVGKLAKVYGDAKGVAVPGKVLAGGKVSIPMVVAAASFSDAAKKKIEAAGGKCMKLSQLAALGTPSGWKIVKRW